LDHLVSLSSGQRRTSKITMPRTAPAPHWCPLGLTPSQRRRIKQIRAQKSREEAVEKERDKHFNIICLVIPMK
jgi:(p)ppGpp synthase/HD superfamily hydrolase